jgi:DNA primase
MITHDTIERIVGAARVDEVVGDFVKLKKRGSNLLGLCPFHNEKTPSFIVSPAKGIYKCFGCGKAGNSVNFIMEHEQCSYPEALRYLADKYHIEIEETQRPQEEIQQKNERDSLYILMAAAQKFYSEQLLDTQEGRSIAYPYLKERKLSQQTIEDFQLGWSPIGWDAFSSWALKNSYSKDYLVRTGMSVENRDGQLIDRYRERIMFPIHNLSGKIVGFGGRIIRSNTDKLAKYINSPETEIYNKSKILYGIHQAKKAVRQLDECIIVEGYMDVLSMYQAGVQHVAASSGTSLTEEQLRLVKRFTENVTFLFDGDSAGQKAALRAIDMALEQGMNVKLALLPSDQDPDSFARSHDKEEVLDYLKKNSRNFVQFRMQLLDEEQKDDPVKRSQLIRELVGSVMLINDTIRQAAFIREIGKALSIEEKILYDELKRMYVEKFRQQNKEDAASISMPPAPPQEETINIKPQYSTIRQEKHVIKIFLLYGTLPFEGYKSVGHFMSEDLAEVEWESPQCFKLFELFRDKIIAGEEVQDFAVLTGPEDTELNTFITDLITEKYYLSENWKKYLGRDINSPLQNYQDDIRSALSYFKLRKVQRLIVENEKDMKDSADTEEINTLLAVHMELSEMKKKIAGEFGAAII